MTLKIKNLEETLLSEYLGENREIAQCDLKRLTAPGENYGSLMLAVDLKLKDKENNEEKTLHLVAKMVPQNEFIQKMFKTNLTFKKELEFYRTIVPTLQEFQRKSGMVPVMDFFPRFYGGRLGLDPDSDAFDDDAVILLENLNSIGYSCLERTKGFDLETAKFVLKDLATLHAVPIALRIKDPEQFQKKIIPYINDVRAFEDTPLEVLKGMKLVVTPSVKADDFKRTLSREMQENGLESELKNNIYRWIKTKKKEISPFDSFFRKSQIYWDKRIHKSLNSMCSELGINLAKLRGNNDKEEIFNKWTELSNLEVDIHKYRPVYAPKDFLEVLLNLNGPIKDRGPNNNWEFSQLPLKVKNLEEMRDLYAELSKGDQILCANSSLNTPRSFSAFEAERMVLGEKILAKNYAPLAQEYLKKGCPRSLRARIWTLLLGAEVKQYQRNYFDSLKEHVLQYDLMIDKLIVKDIALTASNDDQYFVFEDVLYQVMLSFSRDGEILKNLPSQPAFMQVVVKGRQNMPENTIVFPPSGVIPFHGFSMYAAPFCYLFENPVELYYVFRAFYLRYWHRLHRVCANPQGIVSLCLQFEKLLQCFEPFLWNHFQQCRIPPLRLVIKWIMRAFSGHLAPEQLLTLWDLILAYDSLEIIPLLAVVIIIFRKDNLLKVSTLQNVEAVLADLSSIAVIPLLQMALMKT